MKSQSVIAGTQGSIYIDIVPDTLLNALYGMGATTSPESYYIDLNQDQASDIKIYSFGAISSGSGNQYIQVSSLDTSSFSFAFGSLDQTFFPTSSCSPGWYNRNMLKAYNQGDTIKNGAYITSGYLGYDYYICSEDASSCEWCTSTDKYIGVKYRNGGNVIFGWIRVDVSAYQKVLIKDFSLGGSAVGIKQNEVLNSFSISPNPASEKIKIDLNAQLTEIKMTDVSGREILNTQERSIDISALREGIYFVQVKTPEGVLTRKVIVQR